MEMLKKRIWMCLAGVLLCGISVGFFKRAAFGVDPFQSFATGMNAVIPISYGTLYMILCAAFLAFVFVADRHYIGLATIINLTVVMWPIIPTSFCCGCFRICPCFSGCCFWPWELW